MSESEPEAESVFDEDVQAVADALAEHGVPRRRAEIVALADQTQLTYAEIADELGVESKGSVGNQIRAYRETRADAEWLADHAPQV